MNKLTLLILVQFTCDEFQIVVLLARRKIRGRSAEESAEDLRPIQQALPSWIIEAQKWLRWSNERRHESVMIIIMNFGEYEFMNYA